MSSFANFSWGNQALFFNVSPIPYRQAHRLKRHLHSLKSTSPSLRNKRIASYKIPTDTYLLQDYNQLGECVAEGFGMYVRYARMEYDMDDYKSRKMSRSGENVAVQRCSQLGIELFASHADLIRPAI